MCDAKLKLQNILMNAFFVVQKYKYCNDALHIRQLI